MSNDEMPLSSLFSSYLIRGICQGLFYLINRKAKGKIDPNRGWVDYLTFYL